MTQLLNQAFARASRLPEAQQDEMARFLMAELEAEQRWTQRFSTPASEDLLERMALDVLDAHRKGRSRPLDPADL